MEALRSQANQLSAEPGAPTSGPEVNERMSSIDKRYRELIELAKLRHQRLLDALSLYKLFSEADATQQWIGEKVFYYKYNTYVITYINNSILSTLEPYVGNYESWKGHRRC